jgi:hypothetical protein
VFTVTQILLTAGVRYQRYPQWPNGNVFLTNANQLIGTYAHLAPFRGSIPDYRGWHRHHVVERDDLDRMKVQGLAPRYEDQLCVLLPERSHIGRIGSILPRMNNRKYEATREELREAYIAAYELMGNYCGGGEINIRRELLAIVDAEFQHLGIP